METTNKEKWMLLFRDGRWLFVPLENCVKHLPGKKSVKIIIDNGGHALAPYIFYGFIL